jgi:hypothetical protein
VLIGARARGDRGDEGEGEGVREIKG